MHRTSATIRAAGAGPALEALKRANPDWAPWLAAVEAAVHALDAPPATTVEVTLAVAREDGTPLLDGAMLRIDAAAAAAWVQRLFAHASGFDAAEGLTAVRMGPDEALVLLEAAIERDLERLRRFAADTVDDGAEPVLAIADLAAYPILQASGERVESLRPGAWPYGHCPICGAWAALAELRGLEKKRCLRCARCGSEWQVEWMLCPFCGETDHRKLGSLTPEHGAETRRIDKCESCRAYVKTVTTLSAKPAACVLLDDAETVDLDIAALERGYARPPGGGRLIDVTLEARS
jgi:FdhE protein